MVDLGQKGVRNHERLFYFIFIKKARLQSNQACFISWNRFIYLLRISEQLRSN